MQRRWQFVTGSVALLSVIGGALAYANFDALVPYAAMGINWVRYLGAPAGTLATEVARSNGPIVVREPSQLTGYDSGADWASYNKTLTSNRYSPLAEINRSNVANMKVVCTFNTGVFTGFNSGLVEVGGQLLFATEFDTYSIDPNDCRLLWKTHESYTPASPQGVNRGVAVMGGRVFRGTQDGRVIAYSLHDGKRLWVTRIADGTKGESAPAAPIAWDGLVFIGNAGGDVKGVKGRMYALDATTGQIRWEFYLVPKSPGDIERGPQATSPLDGSSWQVPTGSPITGGATWTSYTLDPQQGLLYVPGGNPAPDFAAGVRKGANLYSGSVVVLDARSGAYRKHFKLVPRDWHDWDVSSAPALIRTAGGKSLMMVAPKDGHLYGFDLTSGQLLYRLPVTAIQNADVPFTPGRPVHFCPGSTGGAEWNGPAYDPLTNQVMIGEIEWCTTVKVMPAERVLRTNVGQPWSGESSRNPYNTWGKADSVFHWAGWVHAVDADTGRWRWRARSNYPVQSGVTPTAGGLTFFGDMGGNFYALDSASGRKLWGAKIGGAVGGGVITYDSGSGQRVAAATGLTEVLWPTEITKAKVVVLGIAPNHRDH